MGKASLSRIDLGRLLAAGTVAALLLSGLPGLRAQQASPMVSIQGSVQDIDGDPVVGARVVYRLVDAEGVFISTPTDATGTYSLDLPSGANCRPVAVLVAGGTRVDLGEVASTRAVDGVTHQINIDRPMRWNPSAVVQNFPGSDRMFRSYAEDTAIVDHFRLEAQVQRQEGDAFDRGLMNVIGTASFKAIPAVEFGAKLSLVGVNTNNSMSGDGLGDTDLWAKYALGATQDSRHELAFGAVVTLPTGSDSKGAGFGSTGSKLFAAARREFSAGVFTGNVNLTFNGDGEFFDASLEGKTALGVNFGVIVPWTFRLAFVGEVGYATERFEDWGAEAGVLGGVNVLLKEGSIRGALGLGLDDGSPDVELTVGYAFLF